MVSFNFEFVSWYGMRSSFCCLDIGFSTSVLMVWWGLTFHYKFEFRVEFIHCLYKIQDANFDCNSDQ